jgi:hypothetical protein
MCVRARRKPDQGQPDNDGDNGQYNGGDQVPKQLPAVGVFGLMAQWRLPAFDIVTASP